MINVPWWTISLLGSIYAIRRLLEDSNASRQEVRREDKKKNKDREKKQDFVSGKGKHMYCQNSEYITRLHTEMFLIP